MSNVTDYLNQNIKPLCDVFFDNHAHQFDLTTDEGSGKYTEALIAYLRSVGHNEVGHLKKHGSATQYNGHATDAFLYNVPDPTLLRAVDFIGASGSTNPNDPPRKNFGIDEPRYTTADWMATPNGGSGSGSDNMVPWVEYDEHGFDELKRELAYDYARRPQGADWDVSVWSARVFHSAYMGPSKVPLGLNAALLKHRPEWCGALGVAVVPIPPSWHIGDPV